VANLDNDDVLQLTLPFEERHRIELDAALDEIRDRFGAKAIVRAVLLGRDARPSPPLLPD
jgi:DNA polymerase-4